MSDEASNEDRQFGLLDERAKKEPPVASVHEHLDELLDLLADSRCRHILSYLHETSVDAVELTDLVAAVVARESDLDNGNDHYEAVAIDAHHTYLPKLEAAGLLEYDARSRTIRFYGHPLLEEFLVLANEDGAQTGEPRQND